MSTAAESLVSGGFDVERVRRDFPALDQKVRSGRPLVYLDNAATIQKPLAVIEAIDHFYRSDNSNVHRGLHELSERATRAYEAAREKVQRFLRAADSREIVFTRSTTEAINLVAQSYGRTHLGTGDEILLTAMEHHSNIVPWQMVAEQTGARIRVVPMNDDGELLMDQFDELLTDRTRFVSVVHLSNSLGTINPVEEIVEKAHRLGVPVLLDGAQAVGHLDVDVRTLGCDFYVFSGHKMYGPTGIGVLFGNAALLEAMPPYQGGGDMIRSVSFEKTLYNRIPFKFEAGTPNIAGAIGLGAALDYFTQFPRTDIMAHEAKLLAYATERLGGVPGLRIIGTARRKAGIASFVLEGIHPHDIGTILDQEGIAVRAGHHCTQPVMERFGLPATVRASLGMYNNSEDIDALVEGLAKVVEVLG